MINIKKIIPLLFITVLLINVILTPPKTYAMGALVKIVAGETADQVIQGIAYKAGQAFNDQSSLDKARARWNVEGYEKAKAYETTLSNEEKARWDAFEREVKTSTVTPIPDKPGWGKVLLSGAAFLTGLDLVYNAATAFQSGMNSGQEVPTHFYNSGGTHSVSYTVGEDQRTVYIRGTSVDGGSLTAVKQINNTTGLTLKTSVYPSRGTSSVGLYYSGSGGIVYAGSVTLGGLLAGSEVPVDMPVQATGSDGVITNIPEPFRNMGVIPNTNNVPEIPRSLPVKPDTFIEIEVPLESTKPQEIPEIEPLTIEKWSEIVEVPPLIEPEKPVNPDDPDNPENPDDPDNPVGPKPNNPTDPVRPSYPKPEKPPLEKPEFPGETTEIETPGLFSKLWEWLKSLLEVLYKILNAIVMLPFTMLEMLWDFLIDIGKALFIPDDGYWDNNLEDLRKLLWNDEMEELQEEFEDLGGGTSGTFKDVIVSLLGVDNLLVIDASVVNSVLDTIHKWVRGVFYPFLLIYNINMLYKLVRGTSLVEMTRLSRNKAGD